MLDDLYPLYGRLKLSPQNRANLHQAQRNVGCGGGSCAPERLGIKLGETIKLGNATYQVQELSMKNLIVSLGHAPFRLVRV